MKKILLILLTLTLCACQAPTKSTTSTSKKACDVTSEEESATKKTILKQILMKLALMKPFNTSLKKNRVFYISDFQVVLGAKKLNPF